MTAGSRDKPVREVFSLSVHDAYGRIEDQFNEALDESLDPGGPDMLYDIVAELGPKPSATVVDVGCGSGSHAIELAKRFGLRVVGIDAAEANIEIARRDLAREASPDSELKDSVTFEEGIAERLPFRDRSVELVWCRDVLSLVEDLREAYAEFRRVLKPGGHVLVYQMFATERLEPDEEAWLLPTMGCYSANMSPKYTEAAMRDAGLRIERCIVLGTEWGEYAQERTGKPGRKLLHAARLLREPERYIRRYGQTNYDIALGDCLWHVYRMIGKLSGRVYLLSADSATGGASN